MTRLPPRCPVESAGAAVAGAAAPAAGVGAVVAAGAEAGWENGYVDFGTAGGCPPHPRGSGLRGCFNGWTLADVAHVSNSGGANPLPEVVYLSLRLSPIDYEGLVFRSVSNSAGGDVGAETVFHYHQENELVWATYLPPRNTRNTPNAPASDVASVRFDDATFD